MNIKNSFSKTLVAFFVFLGTSASASMKDLQSVQNFSGPRAWWGSVEVSLLTPTQADAVFFELKKQREFAWDYQADECYAKAYLVSYLLNRAGVKSLTAWSVAPEGAPLLRVETANDPKGCTTWVYHVAAGVAVQNPDGSIEGKILDPALATGPIGLWQWVGLMTAHYKAETQPIVWTSHPYTYRKEDLGQPRSNKLLTEAEFNQQYLERYKGLLSRDRKRADSPSYQEKIKKVKAAIASGQHPARQHPNPCPTERHHGLHVGSDVGSNYGLDFEFEGLINIVSPIISRP